MDTRDMAAAVSDMPFEAEVGKNGEITWVDEEKKVGPWRAGFFWVTRTFVMPTTRELCWLCNGDGKHVNPSIDSNGITSSEMAEMGPEFEEDYFSGVYDMVCNACKGERWTLVPDFDAADSGAVAAWQASREAAEHNYWLGESERRAGC